MTKEKYQALPENQYPVLDDESEKTSVFSDWGTPNHQDHDNFQNYQSIVPLDKDSTWFHNFWRPAIAWQYLAVCLFDFIIMPIIVISFYYQTGQTYAQWQPLTLMGGGLYHAAMGVIIGVATYGRTREKLIGVE